MTDENQLIEQLRDAMRAHTADAEVPDGFADQARQTARRRTTRRAAAATTPLLAAAAVAVVLVTDSSSDRGSPQARDTAYIVGRVTANVAADVRDGVVTYGTDYSAGRVSPQGAVFDTGARLSTGYTYDAPDGTVYWRSYLLRADGATRLAESSRFVPTADGRYTATGVVTNPATKTYGQYRRVVAAPFSNGPAPNLFSSPAALRRALQQGQVTRLGTTTIADTKAIVLSVIRPAKNGLPAERIVLDVDAKTYQPLRSIRAYLGDFGTVVENWLPRTAHNLASAEDDTIPAGYRRVARPY